MRAIACLFLALAGAAFAGDGPVEKVIHFGRSFGSDPLPTFDKGYLLYLNRPGNLAVYGPDGMLVFETAVLGPQGRAAPGVSNAAIDTDGTVAVTAAFSGPQGYGGGIAFLDPSGKQRRFVETGRYMPAHLCFDQDHFLWAFGWQRDEVVNTTEDHNDYFLVRKFSKDGKEAGAYLPRSLFPGKRNPFSARIGLWQVRAAQDRIGALAFPSSEHPPEWFELDLDGKLIGRWIIGKRLDGGYAYTADGRLFGKSWDQKSKTRRLVVFDKNAASWSPVEDVSAGAGDDSTKGLLLGADGSKLVFAEQGGSRLIWVNPKP